MATKEVFRLYSLDYFSIGGMTNVLRKVSQKGDSEFDTTIEVILHEYRIFWQI